MGLDKLLRNPTSIGDIFFSGSQDVKKGEQVTWILDDTWAFKATEDCGVSTNASPFVNIKVGQTFIIYQRTQKDIDDNNDPSTPPNTKGIYIFDRDTVVALAYPQEVTQDIIIENDIYNDNINNININVEAQKRPPKASISLSNTKPLTSSVVTISSSSFAYAPATIATYKWLINGSPVGNGAASFVYTTGVYPAEYTIELEVKDSEGLIGNTKAKMYSIAKPILNDIIMTYDFQTGANGASAPFQFAYAAATDAGVGSIEIKASIAVSPRIDGRTFYVDIFRGSTKIKRQELYVEGNQIKAITAIATYSGSIGVGDVFKAIVGRTDQRRSYKAGKYLNNTPQMQIKITNRTS